jgi:hypothetical protein
VKTFTHFLAAILLAVFISASAAPTNSITQVPNVRLKIKLFDGWRQADNTNGPSTFYHGQSDSPLQISWGHYRGQKPLPKYSTDVLKTAAIRYGQKNGFGELVDSSGGSCAFGSFGTAIFHSATHPRIQVWFAIDEKDCIFGTFICSKEPDPAEVREAQDIMSLVTLGPEIPK